MLRSCCNPYARSGFMLLAGESGETKLPFASAKETSPETFSIA